MLDRNTFFIKERAGLIKLTDVYDIFDPDTQKQIGIAKEEPPGWAKWLRLLINKRLMPTKLSVYADENQAALFTIHRPIAMFRTRVEVRGPDQSLLGYFKSKLFALGGGFFVHDASGAQVAEVKGDWKGWNFKFLGANGVEIGVVTKKWAGAAKEFFTTADNYVISLNGGTNSAAATLLIAAGLAIDVVYKEKG